MVKVDLTIQEVNNLLAFLTGKQRLQLTGDEAFEFVKIVHKLQGAQPCTACEEVKESEPIEQTGISEANEEESE